MHEAVQGERKPTSLGRTRLAARFGLWPSPPESTRPWAARRLRAAWTGPLQRCQSRSLRELKKKKKFRNSRFLEHSPACPLPHPALRLLAIEEVRCQLFLKLERNLPEARECAAAADRNIALSCCQKARPSTQTWNSRVPFSFRPWVPRPISPRPGRGSGRRGLCSYFRFRIISQTPGGVPAPPPTPLPPRPPNSDLPRACCCPPPPLPNQRAQLPPPLRLAD